jgi:hypothetical protein
MHPSAVFEVPGIFRRSWVASAVIGACMSAALLVVSSAAATSPTARACPSVSIVNAALGEHGRAPVATNTAFSKICTYPGSASKSIFWTKITFQVDSASQFAVDEKSAGRFGAKIVKVHALGQAAWTTNTGDLYVFDGHEQIKILALSLGVLSPSTATAKVEALARKLL